MTEPDPERERDPEEAGELEDRTPDPSSKRVDAKILEEEAVSVEFKAAADAASKAGDDISVPPARAALTEQEVTAARWFSIAFLIIVIPLAFIVVGAIMWALVRMFAASA